MMKLLYLFITFFRIGLFAVGGGLATLPFLFELADNAVEVDGAASWLTREMIGNMLAVAQSSPGAIGANLSAYTGLRYAGIGGGYAAVLGLITPSIIIIIIVARMLKAFKENAVVESLFSGFRPAAAGLLSAAGFGAIALSLWNAAAPVWYLFIRWKEALIFAVIFFLIFKFKKHPIIYIAAAGVIGIVLKL
jgi:chromate transporter